MTENGPLAEFPLHLLRLASSSLPVGAFAYSRGLESAIDRGWLCNERDVQEWTLGLLEHVYATLDGALFVRMIAALTDDDVDGFRHCDTWLRASRESRELQLEDLRMGAALQRLLRDLDVSTAALYTDVNLSFAAAFALAAHHWTIPCMHALRGLMWSVVESQVTAAMRLVPLGQTSGQRIMISSVDVIGRSAALSARLSDEEIGNTAPALAMVSAWHEFQYSRLFRS